MLLEEIREKIRIKQELVLTDPDETEENRKFLTTAIQLFNNREAILKCPKSVILGLLYAIGYPHSEIRTVYDDLIKELNRVYTMVDPEDLEKVLRETLG